ncbi:hypothetical protein A3Q32_02715 [Alcanivorax sp. KX64203]|nr:hypothetical protein A3Q32_02715 [Alcanivorax sp. KX64203]
MKNKEHMNMTPHGLTVLSLTATLTLSACGGGSGGGSGGGAPLPPKLKLSNFQPADVVLGQADFSSSMPNDGNQDGQTDEAPSARTLNYPYDGVDSNGRQLAIADSGNARVLIWNSFPTANFQPADVVLGQSDFAHYVPNDDDQDGSMDSAASARVMISPTGVRFHQDKLLVSDEGANRVLVFQSQ